MGIFWGMVAATAQAEVRASGISQQTIPIGQLRRVSDTPVVDTGEAAGNLPSAVPYGSIAMPPLPQPVSRTVREVRAVPVVAVAPVAPSTVVSVTVVVASGTAVVPPRINAESCRAALKLTGEVALMAYEQVPDRDYMNVIAAVSLADDAVRAGGIPNLAAFRSANDDLPWFGPYRSQLRQGASAIQLTCTPMSGVPKKE